MTWRPNWHEELFLEVKYFSGKFGTIREKLLRTLKNVPATYDYSNTFEFSIILSWFLFVETQVQGRENRCFPVVLYLKIVTQDQ